MSLGASALDRPARPAIDAPWRPWEPTGGTWIRPSGRVDSVQWLDLPRGPAWDLASVERLYFAWVPRLCASQVRPHWTPLGDDASGGPLRLAIEPFAWPPVIRMAPPLVTEETRVRPIVGGWLAFPQGSLDFELRQRPAGRRLVVAVRGLSPRLPLPLYTLVQTRMHERSTFAFLREIRRRAKA